MRTVMMLTMMVILYRNCWAILHYLRWNFHNKQMWDFPFNYIPNSYQFHLVCPLTTAVNFTQHNLSGAVKPVRLKKTTFSGNWQFITAFASDNTRPKPEVVTHFSLNMQNESTNEWLHNYLFLSCLIFTNIMSIPLHFSSITTDIHTKSMFIITQWNPQVLGLNFLNNRTRAIYRPTH